MLQRADDGKRTACGPLEHKGEKGEATCLTGEASAAGLDAASGRNLETFHRIFPRWTGRGVGTL